MGASNQNTNLWIKNINRNNNGENSIGSYITSPIPFSINKYMQCNIPKIKSHDTVILLKHPKRLHTFTTNEEVEANTSLSFPHNSTQLSVKYSAYWKSSRGLNKGTPTTPYT